MEATVPARPAVGGCSPAPTSAGVAAGVAACAVAFAVACRIGDGGGPLPALSVAMGVPAVAAVQLLPGVAAAAVLRRRGAVEGAAATIATVLAVCGAVAMVAFFAWWAHPVLGWAWSLGSLGAGAVVAVRMLPGDGGLLRAIAVPVALGAAISVAMTGVAFDQGGWSDGTATVTARYWNGDDNLLPEVLADRLYLGEDLEPRLYKGWLSSDRPPLQAGWVLLTHPLAGDRTVGYQLASTTLQALWVPAVWAVAAAAGLERRTAVGVVLLLAASGFVFVNTVFVWPKLLAGALVLCALAVLVERGRQAEGRGGLGARDPAVAVAAACVALGALAHAGGVYAAFGLVPVVWAQRRWLLDRRAVLLAIGVAVALYGPWFAYQRLADPPGDALVKWHVAGVIDVEERFTLLEAMGETYGELPVGEIVGNKLDSVRLQVGVPELWRNWWFTPGWGDTLVERLRVAQLTASVWGAGLLLAGLPVLLLRRDARLRPLRWVVPASLLGWFVVQYGDIGPAGAFAHHGPYGTFLLGYALLAVGVWRLPPWPRRLVVAAHLAVLAVLWLGVGPMSASPPPHPGSDRDWSMVAVALIGTLAALALARLVSRTRGKRVA